jgi:DNA repair protein RadC
MGRTVDEAKHRLLRLGPEVLSDTELIALVTGISCEHSLAALMAGGIFALIREPPEVLLEVSRVSSRGVARLLAAAELGRRLQRQSPDRRPRLGTPEAIWEWAQHQLAPGRRESFHVLCLNPRNVLLRHVRVAVGSVDQCHVDPREALAPAVACRASALVLLHNHPSGDPEPSPQDLALTRQLREGARLLCIKLVDHLVISDTGYVSMHARGLIRDERPLSARLQPG